MMLVMYLTRRRTLLTLGALGGTAAAVRLGASPERPGDILAPAGVVPLRAAELPLVGELAAHGRGRAEASGRVTGVLDVGVFRQLALTWEGALPGSLHVRTRSARGWTPWQELRLTEHRDADEGNGRLGTDLVGVEESDRVQVRVQGPAPRALNLVAIDPGWLPSDEPRLELTSTAPEPFLYRRPAWGADESWRNSAPVIDRNVAMVHVHHTVSRNGYTAAEVPGMIRGMYHYHTQSLGWSDIGYNFLVDKFGRCWVGRAGGPRRPVRGAHTLGFNTNSTGIAAIGNFETARPGTRMLTGITQLAAWKLDAYGIAPRSTVRVRSGGSDRYPKGMIVRLPRICGHRDTNHTACPGDNLWARLPDIRGAAQRRADRYS